MISKKQNSLSFFNNNSCFICPICKSTLMIKSSSLLCKNNHNYDISKKGVVCLINTGKLKRNYTYDKDLFISRRKFILNNFYKDIYINIIKILNSYSPNNISILDLGCGEGTHDSYILNGINKKYCFLGIDYNKDAVNLAINYNDENTNFIVSDVNELPLKDNSFDIIINILSPYFSNEVLRVLKKDGLFIKIIPDKNYLIELRNSLGFEEYEKTRIIKNKLEKNFSIIKEIRIDKKYHINEEQLGQLLTMTPLIKSKKINKNIDVTIHDITINLRMLIMRRK